MSASLQALAAHGVRLKVLAQVFSVLRHEVVGPLSNATLAAAMLRQTPEGASPDALQQRCQRLAGDLTGMLEDSVAVVRDLDQWLADHGAIAPADALLSECRKLMFSHLLLSRRSVTWSETVAAVQLPTFASRYLLLAWLLCLLQALPADSDLALDFSQADAWHARFSAAPDFSGVQPATFDPQEVELLADASGWRLVRQADCWSLHLPVLPDE
ncbi:hypothetical protein CQ050_26745 [Achromobacter sp. MYb9]|uniref:hypothetical protein n=1 Tax=Achromobacter sp. MYb9 TaxID=1827284 RepID=UPI000CFC664C|nr:hypothetical protein [Achromobacter sp. MYb9]PQZ59971.1 hypothetical protein CQ050_26745 [Achromobacter sp. MYb9]